MTTYYKAVRYDYGSFRNPEFMYGPAGTVHELGVAAVSYTHLTLPTKA